MKSNSRLQKAAHRGAISLVLVLTLVTATVSAYAATVRGRLDRRDGYGRTYAAAYVNVTLFNSQLGRSAPAYTGTDGMYYFYNVPPGYYTLQLWLYPGRQPLSYRIQVYDQPYTDISPLLIP